MKIFRPILSLLLALCASFVVSSQTVSNVAFSPTPAYTANNITAIVTGQLFSTCDFVNNAWATVQGTTISIYVDFNSTGVNCQFSPTSYTRIVGVGALPAGTYTVNTYNFDSNTLLFANQLTVLPLSTPCQPPALNQLSASNLTTTSARLNSAALPGALQYQFRVRPVNGNGIWFVLPATTLTYADLSGLMACTTYEFQASVNCGSGWTSFSVSRTFATVCVPNPTNNCNNPVHLTCNTPYNSSNSQGVNTFTSYFQNGQQLFSNMTGPETVHRFTVNTATNVTITLAGLSADLDLLVLSNCNNTSLVAYSGNGGNAFEQITFNSLPVGTYTVIVDGWSGAVSNYQLTVTCGAPPAPCSAPTYDQVTATNLTDYSVRLQTSVVASQYVWAYRPLGTTTWLQSAPTANNYYDIFFLQPNTTYEYRVQVRCTNGQWSPWTPIKTFTTVGMTTGTTCLTAIPTSCGGTYYGNTTNGGSNYGMYTFNNTNIFAAGRERIYTFTQAVGGPFQATLSSVSAELDLFLIANCNAMTTIARSINGGLNNEVINIPFLAAGTYQLVVDGWGPTGAYTLHLPCGTASENPCPSTNLTVGATCVPVTGSNIGATATTNPAAPTACNVTNIRDVWFRFLIPASGAVRVTTGPGSLIDGVLGVYTGAACNSLAYYGCFDNTNGDYMPDITINGTPGTTIYLRVWGVNGTTGTFTICTEAVYNLTAGGADVDLSAEDRAPTDVIATLRPTMKLYPVPVNDVLNIEASGLRADAGSATVRVIGLDGRVALERTDALDGAEGRYAGQLDVRGLAAGWYVVQVRVGEQVLNGRFNKF